MRENDKKRITHYVVAEKYITLLEIEKHLLMREWIIFCNANNQSEMATMLEKIKTIDPKNKLKLVLQELEKVRLLIEPTILQSEQRDESGEHLEDSIDESKILKTKVPQFERLIEVLNELHDYQKTIVLISKAWNLADKKNYKITATQWGGNNNLLKVSIDVPNAKKRRVWLDYEFNLTTKNIEINYLIVAES